jgi:hypothetical protein
MTIFSIGEFRVLEYCDQNGKVALGVGMLVIASVFFSFGV